MCKTFQTLSDCLKNHQEDIRSIVCNKNQERNKYVLLLPEDIRPIPISIPALKPITLEIKNINSFHTSDAHTHGSRMTHCLHTKEWVQSLQVVQVLEANYCGPRFKWAGVRDKFNPPDGSLHYYRTILDSMRRNEIIWRPYAANEIQNLIPGYCLADREVWLAEVDGENNISPLTAPIPDQDPLSNYPPEPEDQYHRQSGVLQVFVMCHLVEEPPLLQGSLQTA
ncbi:serine/threonine-protein phosphatase 7 long form-like protein [Senna tora]|uniref:Serine/threonine-protein phosphatase 7 long form-like protein n=1 Tax=Senna tora TaxID=362788 RepID=A0A835CHA9_9FABA|nr:serine/threonine-protein phosphatase 7 long form-like protein [Senna tora]